MILIKSYKIIDDKCLIWTIKIWKKYKNDEELPFDINDPISCYKHLKEVYGKYRSKEGLPLAFTIVNFGGLKGVKASESIRTYFPGYGKDGKRLSLGTYGRLDYFPRFYKQMVLDSSAEITREREKREKEEEDAQLFKEGKI